MGRPETGLENFRIGKGKMQENEFWKLIETIHTAELDKLSEDDYPEELLVALVQALSKRQVRDIEAFEDKLSFFLYQLDGRKYADNAGESGQSGDGFLYARCWVVAKGRDFYERVLKDPKMMPKDIRHWCEPLLYVSAQAWAMSTGQDEEEWDYIPEYDYETGSNEALWGSQA